VACSCVFVLGGTYPAGVRGQADLPVGVQAGLLRNEILDAAKVENLHEVLTDIDQYKQLKVDCPPALLLIEAKAAHKTNAPLRAFTALKSFLAVAQENSPSYNEALRLYPIYQKDAAPALEKEREKQKETADEPAIKQHLLEVHQEAGSSVAAASNDSPYGDLIAKSSSLTETQRSAATELVNAGVRLSDSGDCASASLALRQALDLDPANIRANYYLGYCLRKTRTRTDTEALEYMKRASSIRSAEPEHFKAVSQVKEMSAPETAEEAINSLSSIEHDRLYVGTWQVSLADASTPPAFTLYRNARGALAIKGSRKNNFTRASITVSLPLPINL
jgi:tetratricopeptide (TPR) repeat protein